MEEGSAAQWSPARFPRSRPRQINDSCCCSRTGKGYLHFRVVGKSGFGFEQKELLCTFAVYKLLCAQTLHCRSRWRVYDGYGWRRKWPSAWLLLNLSCSVHPDSEHPLEGSDSQLDLSLWAVCGKRELACYNSTWTCFNWSLPRLEGGMHIRNAKAPSGLLSKMKLNFPVI